MTRTIWFAVFCMVGLGAVVTIKTARPSAHLTVESAADQGNIELAAVPNELTKSDRLPLPDLSLQNARAESVESEASAPPAMTSEETPAAEPETVQPETIQKAEHRRWRDANAKIAPSEKIAPSDKIVAAESARKHARRDEPKKSTGTATANAKAEPKPGPWHCRQDAMGSVLRSLDLSPRCDL